MKLKDRADVEVFPTPTVPNCGKEGGVRPAPWVPIACPGVDETRRRYPEQSYPIPEILPRSNDNCPDVFNPDQADEDADGVGDVSDGSARLDATNPRTQPVSD